MTPRLETLLNPDRALVFRITHADNLPWILKNGLHCRSSGISDPLFVTIGSEDLITKRTTRRVPVPPGGLLSDYIPFYFTPFSPMLYMIRTGQGVTRRPNDEIVILVSSLARLRERRVEVVITDRHAYLKAARYSDDPDDVRSFVPWERLQEKDFRRDPMNPEAFERYQAEALAHEHVPVAALLGVVCYSEAVRSMIDGERLELGLEVQVLAKPRWYF